jgi:hypothetical protein
LRYGGVAEVHRPDPLRLAGCYNLRRRSFGAGRALVSELSEEAQSKRRRLADRFSALIR